jgi:hypothetical protein
MEEALSFFRAFEAWIYLLLGLGGLIYVRKFIMAWQELRGAGFGLERVNAQARLNQSASVLVLLLTMTVSEFVLVSFVTPTMPGANPLLTPTLDLLATPTITLPPAVNPGEAEIPQVTPVLTTTVQVVGSGCLPGQIVLDAPKDGQEVSGVVEVVGTAEISNFGFYKLEMKTPDQNTWATLQAGNQIRKSAKLGDWDTRRLPPGEYELSLIVVDNQAKASQPCIVHVMVLKTSEETPTP